MNAQDYISIGLAVSVICSVIMQLRHLRHLKNVIAEVESWRSGVDREIRRAQEGVYETVREMASGFEALGLQRRPARSASGPFWLKPNEQLRSGAITGGR